MLVGRFGDTTRSRCMEAYVSFPRSGLRGSVSFLVDTGADASVLMPADARKLGVVLRRLTNPTIGQATAKLNDIDSEAWLADVLRRSNDHPASKLDELRPWSWPDARLPSRFEQWERGSIRP